MTDIINTEYSARINSETSSTTISLGDEHFVVTVKDIRKGNKAADPMVLQFTRDEAESLADAIRTLLEFS